MQRYLSFLSIAFLFAMAARGADYEPQEGDLVFQSLAHNDVIDAIEGCSNSPYSHCGIVINTVLGWAVLEAVGPVKQGPLNRWIEQGRDRKFAVFRLKAKHRPKIPNMIAEARKFVGLPYDIQYELDDEKIYCSELIYTAWLAATGEKMGTLVKLGDLNWKPHEPVIRAIAGNLPLERLMITPRDLASATQLEMLLPLDTHQVIATKKKKKK